MVQCENDDNNSKICSSLTEILLEKSVPFMDDFHVSSVLRKGKNFSWKHHQCNIISHGASLKNNKIAWKHWRVRANIWLLVWCEYTRKISIQLALL